MSAAMQAKEMKAPLLRLHAITKRFSGVTALNGVDFELHAGEVHALLGENGAGKSTLIKVLAGVHRADEGAVFMDGNPVDIHQVADAERYGIRVIHQELSLAPNLTVAENIYLGREPKRFGLLNRRQMNEDARTLVKRLGLEEIAAVHLQVSTLSIAQRQLVEIARALSSEARVLILDEPTSSLSGAETEALFVTLDRLRKQGVGIIYISHRLEEVLRLADRITVLRDGSTIGTQQATQVNKRELVHWLVGRDITDYFHRPAHKPGKRALEVRGLRNERVRGVSLQVRYGEILGIAGLVGSGRSELMRAIFGVDRFSEGEIRLDGERVEIHSPGDAVKAGIILIPEDRQGEGLVMMQSVGFNIALPWLKDWIHAARFNRKHRSGIIDRAITSCVIKVSNPDSQPVDSLSGGNQQKVLVSRWMERRPKVLILDEPTRGVDVGAREDMFQVIAGLVEEGMAVILISSDLAEVLSMSHRVAVYRDGAVVKEMAAEEANMEDVMGLLTGVGQI